MVKQTTITIETSSLLILHSRKAKHAWCPVCCAEVEMIFLSNQEMSSLGQWIESGELHRSEAADGATLICLNSLLTHVQTTKSANCGIPRLPNTQKERI